jgi:hypothetical protein
VSWPSVSVLDTASLSHLDWERVFFQSVDDLRGDTYSGVFRLAPSRGLALRERIRKAAP